jgi:hypothetical protein
VTGRAAPSARVAGLLRRHWLISILVLVGACVRLLTMVAFTPALIFNDSWGYVASAFSGSFVRLASVHPVGYPILMRLFTLPDRSLGELVAFQHLTAIAVGLAVYATLCRARLPRWAAAAAAALVLLDGYSITLEQYVMSDTFFTAVMLLALLVLAWPALRDTGRSVSRREWLLRCGGCGLLVALASLIREAAPFAIPVCLVYMLWMRIGWRPLVAFIVAAAVPLLAYSALVDNRYDVFGLTATSGWTLYGRVAGFADCDGVKLERGARGLCETAAERASHPTAPDWYVWGPSPAQRIFKPAVQPLSAVARTNHVLNSFDYAIIRHQPLDFIGATLRDFLRYFAPGAVPYRDAQSATSLPSSPRDEAHDRAVRRRDLRGLRLRVQSPAPLVRSYRGVFHVPRPVLALLAIMSVLGVALRVPARREVLLLSGGALLILLGTSATGGFALRYLLPAVPLLAIGGSLAGAQLLSRWRGPGRPHAAG